MKLSELLQGIAPVQVHGDLEMEITGVSYDSRTTRPGDLFVAMAGFATDGHKYIPAAVEKGAACVLCQMAPAGERSPPAGAPSGVVRAAPPPAGAGCGSPPG